nr:MAG TPA_asm: hypothetical protein [Bacteriophage sp.]
MLTTAIQAAGLQQPPGRGYGHSGSCWGRRWWFWWRRGRTGWKLRWKGPAGQRRSPDQQEHRGRMVPHLPDEKCPGGPVVQGRDG